jgi:hypothetical protein
MILFYSDNRINVAFTVTMSSFLIVLQGVDVGMSSWLWILFTLLLVEDISIKGFILYNILTGYGRKN